MTSPSSKQFSPTAAGFGSTALNLAALAASAIFTKLAVGEYQDTQLSFSEKAPAPTLSVPEFALTPTKTTSITIDSSNNSYLPILTTVAGLFLACSVSALLVAHSTDKYTVSPSSNSSTKSTDEARNSKSLFCDCMKRRLTSLL
jgi:hypothetical protein